MIKDLFSGFDIYLVLLTLLNSYTMIFSDPVYFKGREHNKAKKESIVIGIIILIIVLGGYIARHIWIY